MLNLDWKPLNKINDQIPAALQTWIEFPGSFMQRLRDHGLQHAHVKVLDQRWAFPFNEESLLLDIKQDALIREVLILSDDVMLMFARTILPKQSLTGEWAELAHLGDKALGSIIFKNSAMHRSEFEVTCLQKNTTWYNHAAKVTGSLLTKNDNLWARRSVFSLSEKKILLTEVFFPGLEHVV